MNKLNDARKIINEVDSEIVKLFKKRMDAAKVVALYKKENNLPIYDEEREKTLIAKNLELLNDEELKNYYLIFIEGMLKASKEYQKDLIK